MTLEQMPGESKTVQGGTNKLELKLRQLITEQFWSEVYVVKDKELAALLTATKELFTSRHRVRDFTDVWLDLIKENLAVELEDRFEQKIRELTESEKKKALKIRSAYATSVEFVQSRYPQAYIFSRSSRYCVVVPDDSSYRSGYKSLTSGTYAGVKGAWDYAAAAIELNETNPEELEEEPED